MQHGSLHIQLFVREAGPLGVRTRCTQTPNFQHKGDLLHSRGKGAGAGAAEADSKKQQQAGKQETASAGVGF